MNTSSLYQWNKKRSKAENNCCSLQQKFIFICFFIIVEFYLYDRQESSNTRLLLQDFLDLFLRINGTKEGKNEIWEECEERLNCFLEEKLDMNTDKIWIQRAHRVGKETGHERQIVVQLNSYTKLVRYFEKMQETERH